MDPIQFISVFLSIAYLSAPVAWKSCYVNSWIIELLNMGTVAP